eukprot:s996_g8.t1
MARAERNTILLVHRPWPTRSCALASRLLFKRQCRLQDAGESQVRMGLEHAVRMQTAGSVRLLTDDTGVCIYSKRPLSSMRFLAARTDACPGLWLSRIFAATDLGVAYCHMKYRMYKRAELDGLDVHRMRTPAACQQQSCRGSITSVVAQRFCFPVPHRRAPVPAERPEQHVHLGQTLSDTDVGLLEPLKVLAAARRQSSRSSFAFTPSARRRQQHLSCGRAFATRASSILLSSPGVNRRAVTMDPQCCITSKRALSATRVPAARIDAGHDVCLYSRICASSNLGFTYCRVKYKFYGWGELRGLDVHRMGTPATCQQRPLRRSITSTVVVGVAATTSLQWEAVRGQPGVWNCLQKLTTARQSCLSARHCCVQVRGNAPGQHMHLEKTYSYDTDVGFFNVRNVFMVVWQRDSAGACTNVTNAERLDAGVDACRALCLYSRRSTDPGLKVPERQLEAGRGGWEFNARCAATPATCQQWTFRRTVTLVGLLRNCLQPDRKLDPVVLVGARCNLHIAVAVCSRHLTLPHALRHHCAADQESVILDCGVAVSSSFGMFGGGTATSKAEGCCMVMHTGRSRRTSRLACRPLQHYSGAIAIKPLRTSRAQSRFRMWDRPMSAAVEPSQSRPRKHAMNEAAMFHRTRFPWQPTQGATISERPRSSSRSRGRDVVNALFRDCLQDLMSGSHVEMEAAWEECGLDSLSSIAFSRRLSDTFDLSFDATTFFDFSSPALLAKDIWDRLHDMELYVSPNRDPAQARTGAGQTWRNTDTRGCQLSPLNLQPKPGKVLYICPPFGFGRSYFASWTRWLGDTCEVHVLGGAARCWDTQLQSSAAYIQRTCDSRPFVIFGHSFGSIAAFELCGHLQELHFEMPGCLIVSASPTPGMFAWKKDMAPFNCFDMEVKDAGGVRDILCDFHVLDANMDVLTDDLLMADLNLVKSYMPRSDRKLACPIIGIHANDDVLVPSSRTVAAWSAYTTSTFAMHQIDGTHFFFFRPAAAFVALVQSCLDGYDSTTWPGPGAYELHTFWWGTLDLHTYPFGVSPKGYIIYTDGHVFVHLCDPLVDPAKPLAAAHSHAFYHGTYAVENGAVFHHIEMSNNPNDHADVLGRYFHWQEERRKLTLSTRPDSMRAAGGTLIVRVPLKEPGDWSMPQGLR